MTDERFDQAESRAKHEADWDRSERRSYWIALTIALMPIPMAIVISWAMGAPPWLPHPRPVDEKSRDHSSVPERPGSTLNHGQR